MAEIEQTGICPDKLAHDIVRKWETLKQRCGAKGLTLDVSVALGFRYKVFCGGPGSSKHFRRFFNLTEVEAYCDGVCTGMQLGLQAARQPEASEGGAK